MMKRPTKLDIAIGDLQARGCKVTHDTKARQLTIEHSGLPGPLTLNLRNPRGLRLDRLARDIARYRQLLAEAKERERAECPAKASKSLVDGDFAGAPSDAPPELEPAPGGLDFRDDGGRHHG